MSGRHATPEELGMAQDTVVTHGDDGVEDIEIEVIDDRPSEDRREAAAVDPDSEMSDAEVAELGGRAQKRINKLKWEFHEQRRARETAERMVTEAVSVGKRLTSETQRLKAALEETQRALNDQASRRADGALKAAEEAFKAAHADGDAASIVEAQKAISAALMAKSFAPGVAERVMRDFTTKHEAEVAKGGNGRAEPEVEQPRAVPRPPDPKTQAWFESNPWFGKDRVMTSTAYGVHEALIVEDGVSPESDEYYEKLDAEMRRIFPEKFSSESQRGTEVSIARPSQPAAKPRQTQRTVVAPATRNNGVKTPQKITLTETQVAVAKRLGVPLADYARQLIKEQGNVQ